MLTKRERAEIAERLRDCPEADYYDFYEAVTGAETTIDTLLDEDADKIADVILDLCDTSNMIELPLDKDGKVINIGDKVCDGFGRHLVGMEILKTCLLTDLMIQTALSIVITLLLYPMTIVRW